MPDRSPHQGRESDAGAGFVLIAVLSVTALLALMLGAATLLSRESIDAATIETDNIRTDSMLASGIELAGHQLFVLRVDPASLNGQQVRLDDGTVTLFVRPEAGKVDLNGADAVLLAAAYRAAGLDAMTPADFAARVMDWRDENDETLPGGAERSEYGASGLGYAPPNAPFRSVGDLRWVLGMSDAVVSVLAPFLTVSNPSGKIDPIHAAPTLLAAVPGISPGALEALADAARRSGLDRAFALRFALRGLERHFVLGEELRVFAVRAQARRDGSGPVRTVDAVLIASVVSDRPFQITQWVER